MLQILADELGVDLGWRDCRDARAELAGWVRRAGDAAMPRRRPAAPGTGEAVLATWRMLLDAGRLQDGEPHLAGTARPPVVRLSAATAAEIGAADGDRWSPSAPTAARSRLPLEITDMPDRVVWLPMNSPGSAVYAQLGAAAGDVVRIERGDIS